MMRVMTLLAFIALTAILILGCDHSGTQDFTEEIVLQGSLFVGHPLMVRVTHTIPTGEFYDPRAVGVAGAEVNITAGGRLFTLTELPADTGGAGYYALPADSHLVTPGLQYSIRVQALGHILTGETVAAGPTHILSQNLDTLLYGTTPLYLHWSPDSLCAGYVAIFEMTDADWNSDYRLLTNHEGGNGGSNVRFQRISRFADSLAVPWEIFSRWGDYRVRILSCDLAGWNYFWTFRQGQADNQPVSNVQGGLGVFSAGGADTSYFYLKDNPNIHGGRL